MKQANLLKQQRRPAGRMDSSDGQLRVDGKVEMKPEEWRFQWISVERGY